MYVMAFDPKLRPAVDRLRKLVEETMEEVWPALEPEIRFLQLTAAELDRDGVDASPTALLSTYSNTLGRVRRAVQLHLSQKEDKVSPRAKEWIDDD